MGSLLKEYWGLLCEQHSGGCQRSMVKLALGRGSDYLADTQHEYNCASLPICSVVQSSCYFISMGIQPLFTSGKEFILAFVFFGCTLDQYHFKPGFFCGSPYCYIHTQSIIFSNTHGNTALSTLLRAYT